MENKKTVLITQARVSSTRLPGKTLKKVGDLTLLEIHLKRILKAKKIDDVVLAVADEPGTEGLLDIGKKLNLKTYQGSVEDVLDRYYQASLLSEKRTHVVRVTSDCPLIDPGLIDDIVTMLYKNSELDYVSNNLKKTYPHGLDAEGFKWSALKKAWQEAQEKPEREHVTPFIRNHSSFLGGKVFQSTNIECKENLYSFRLTVDYLEDYEKIQKLIGSLGLDRSWQDYVEFLRKNPEIDSINKRHVQS